MNLDNTDISWEGNYFGLQAILSDRAKCVLASKTAEDLLCLYDALGDPNRFVASHVLLACVHGINDFDASSWCGLEVDIEANGDCIIDPSQMDKIRQFWFRRGNQRDP